MEFYLINLYFPFVLAFILAAVVVYFSIPAIIRVAKLKNLYDEPNEDRKASKKIVPTLGGMAIFLGFIISVVLSSFRMEFLELRYIVVALVIMLFVGLKDDILYISPKSKLIGQVFVAFILVVFADLRFTSLHGLLGIEQLPYFASVVLSMFAITVLTNSLNLIDGIDGLCSGIGVTAASMFAFLFYINNDLEFTLIGMALSGALFSFFIYNVFGDKNKIFMGDTGSLLIGFVLSIMTIRFNEIPFTDHRLFEVKEMIGISLAVMIVPIIDTLRVLSIRILNGKSPFSSDNIHTHHKLLELGLTHFQASLIYIVYNVIFVVVAMILQHYISNYVLILTLLIFAFICVSIPSILVKKGYKKQISSQGVENHSFNRFFKGLADKSNTH